MCPQVKRLLLQHGHEVVMLGGIAHVNDIYTQDGELHEELIPVAHWSLAQAYIWLGY